MEYVRIDIEDHVATVTFDRPPVNALNAQAFRELGEAFTTLRHGTDAHVAIFTAPGERIFCAGVDLHDSARRHGREDADGDSIVDRLDPGSIVRDCFWAISDCPLPVIGAINGAAVGAGLALVACCDVIVASENARFALPEINAGVLGGGRHLQRMVGPYKTRKMFFTGEFVDAHEFHRLGAVETVVSPDELLPTARELAAVMAGKSPIGLRLAKESLNRVEDLGLKDGYRTEQDYTQRITKFSDSAEARRSYLEKRDPEWTWT
ncbi:MAG: enoyl-CoA hydratase-related protein [Acidimicrobiia bacterium]